MWCVRSNVSAGAVQTIGYQARLGADGHGIDWRIHVFIAQQLLFVFGEHAANAGWTENDFLRFSPTLLIVFRRGGGEGVQAVFMDWNRITATNDVFQVLFACLTTAT